MAAAPEASVDPSSMTPIEFIKYFFEGKDEASKHPSKLVNMYCYLRKKAVREDGYDLEIVEAEGGHEGEGESVTRVVAITKDGKPISYFRFTGYYHSEYGTEWDNFFQVVYPREVSVIQYFTEP